MKDDPHRYKRWLDFARNVSKQSLYHTQVGCVICKGNRPISIGFNKGKYNKEYGNPWRKSIHAECDAIRNSGRSFLRNGTAYVYRETKDGRQGMARPCDDCFGKLVRFGIKTIVYSTVEKPFWRIEKI